MTEQKPITRVDDLTQAITEGVDYGTINVRNTAATIRVFYGIDEARAYRGSARYSAYEVAWMGKVLWTEYAGDAETAREAAGVDRADQLTGVVWRVGGLLVRGFDRPCGSMRDRAAPVIWAALPDQLEEPRA